MTDPAAPLRFTGAASSEEGDKGQPFITLHLNRHASEAEVKQLLDIPSPGTVMTDWAKTLQVAMLSEIVARVCRAYMMTPLIRTELPQVAAWLRSYMDGEVGGPLGGPMPWPDLIPNLAQLLRDMGFERSPNGWVLRTGTTAAPEGVKPS